MALKSKSRGSKSKLQLQQYKSKQTKQEEREVTPIYKYLKSSETARMYTWHFNTFLKYWGIKHDWELRQLDPKDVESKIIKYLCDHMSTENHLKKNTVETAMHAIFSFCTMNDIFINRKKISKLIPPDEDHKEDRRYSRDEIAELLKQSTDERFRAVILLMANGLRVGAIPELELGHLIPKSIGPNGEILDDDSGIEKLYQILVYDKSADHRYYTFCTPECRKAIDAYIETRVDNGEDTSIKTSPLIRTQFEKGDDSKPRALAVNSIKKAIERTVQRARIGTKGTVATTHGLRKHAVTMMKLAKVDFSDREYLVGHKVSRGRDVEYDRSEVNERLQEWSKAINKLTINEELRLKKKLQVVEGETNQRIAELETELQEEKAELQREIQRNHKAREEMKVLLAAMKPALDARLQVTSTVTKINQDAANMAMKDTVGYHNRVGPKTQTKT
jgi:hypothetical protein